MSKTNKNESAIEPSRPAMVLPPDAAVADVAERLVAQARNDGVALTGAGGLSTGLVQQVLQASLEGELTERLGYEANAVEDAGRGTRATASIQRQSALRSESNQTNRAQRTLETSPPTSGGPYERP